MWGATTKRVSLCPVAGAQAPLWGWHGRGRPPAGRGASGTGATVTSVTLRRRRPCFGDCSLRWQRLRPTAGVAAPLQPHGVTVNPVSVTRSAMAELINCGWRWKGEMSAAVNPAEPGLGKGAPRGKGPFSLMNGGVDPLRRDRAVLGDPSLRNDVNNSAWFSVNMLVINLRSKMRMEQQMCEIASSTAEATALRSRERIFPCVSLFPH